jgi:hypothetical protein
LRTASKYELLLQVKNNSNFCWAVTWFFTTICFCGLKQIFVVKLWENKTKELIFY